MRFLCTSLPVFLACACTAMPATLGWWRFETVSSNVVDSSGGAHGGLINDMNGVADDGTSGYSTNVPGTLIVAGIVTQANTRCFHFTKNVGEIYITDNLGTLSLSNTTSQCTMEAFVRLASDRFPMRILHLDQASPSRTPPTTLSPFFSTFEPLPLMALSLNCNTSSVYETRFADYGTNDSPIIYGAWHHLAYVKDGPVVSFYVDYQLVSSNTVTDAVGPFTGFDFVRLGGGIDGQNNSFDGWLDEIRYSDQALAPSQFLRVVGGLRPTFRNWIPSGSNVLCRLVTESGALYRVQSSTNAFVTTANWTNATAVFTGGLFHTFMTFTSSPPTRVYRALRSP